MATSKKIKDFNYNFIDRIFEFDGLWGVKSKCGIKRVEKTDRAIIILTDLYDANTGSSVTECICLLANLLCAKLNIAPDRLMIIQHSPEINSKLDFYNETFELVSFNKAGHLFEGPEWKAISRNDIYTLIEE